MHALADSETVRELASVGCISPEAQLAYQSPAYRGLRRNLRVESVCMEGWS